MDPLEHGEEGCNDGASVGLCVALWVELETLWVVVCPETNEGAGEGDQKGERNGERGQKENDVQETEHGGRSRGTRKRAAGLLVDSPNGA